ncbi:polyamine aminopropyltransferase [Pseudoalteromonas sp. SR44-5]|uniref:Polyamine aminopropyltransferase n=2 Tax=Pseudoalteromonas rhizosphaerae TaxID=2518973 RepID=A0ABW8L5H3_9GAMM|nr:MULTISPECIES: polyamine aminopropyltransferase [Pseudoalteromonas]MBB1303658.1 polyamine aminopropyltransferase [Pseudoalteromonas sp. SR44-8]MBB1311560.1 polyamine aminopropyltransferase [Pseudoalteromonas sp. SR41-8]MBB1335430.1 polyamine aminopropyltransferase [Pseudoalteromonas sp. SR41-6]MBB1368476.1 polyamine aminopropyltransferase [Pseudoalteromonas sp. SR44-5]MBB1399785.1 polyamine aminopropyltransferase [Pseudoalteromonas sp. SG44-8]
MSHSKQSPSKYSLLGHDFLLITVMAILAGCGLIYEYLLSHYAGRVLGSVESAIYAMIGTMIVAMGIGAFLARWFKDAFTAFAWLESLIALVGMGCILAIASVIAVSYSLPHIFSDIFNLPADVILNGYIFQKLQEWSRFLPYVFGLLLGLLIGMEIPLIARIRQHVYGRFLENNAGTIYGADYIGAGIGAAIWVSIMLAMPIMQAAAWTALFNIIAGLAFLWRYHSYVRYAKLLLVCHIALLVLFGFILMLGSSWMKDLSNVLYKDKVIYSEATKYQHLVLTERLSRNQPDPITDLYLNGRLQFSSIDEQIYHSMLVYPPLLASNRHDNVLIIGGGDGLALRDVLKWPVKEVTLIDLDAQLLSLFGHDDDEFNPPAAIHERLTKLNKHSMADPRSHIKVGDAFLEVERLLDEGKRFDTIIIDLPDPNHPDLNKMYSDYFYNHIRQLLAADGAMAVQSTSPYHAKKAFLSIGKTVKAAGFKHVEQYQQNIPSFGQWGWTIATTTGQSASARISDITSLPVASRWISKKYLLAAFVFPNHYFEQINDIEVNQLGSGTLYDYYRSAWQIESELYKN